METFLFIDPLQSNVIDKSFTFAVFGPGVFHLRDDLKKLGGYFIKKDINGYGSCWGFKEEMRKEVNNFIEKIDSDLPVVMKPENFGVVSKLNLTNSDVKRIAIMENYINKMKKITLSLEDTLNGTIFYQTAEGSSIIVNIDKASIAKWDNGKIAFIKKYIVDCPNCEVLPFSGLKKLNCDKECLEVMENFICYLTLTSTEPTKYYTDGACTYAFCKKENLSEVMKILDLEMV